MGNKQTSNSQFQAINLQQWQEIPSGQAQHPEYGQYRTFRHIQNQKIITEYQIVFSDEEDFKIYLQSFIWRLRQPKIVQTMYLTEDHKNQLCSKTYSAKVYVEFIKTRLSDITDIPFPENLYVGLSMLEGYSKLYENISYFHIEENQVCVDMEGHVKVWINADLSKNYPCYGDDGMNLSSCDMVQEIIRIVTENTDKQTEPHPLQEFFKQQSHGPIGFQEAKIIISEYARKYHTKIPTFFQSIVDIYKRQQEQQNQEEEYQQHQQQQAPPGFYRQEVSQVSQHHSPEKFRKSNGMLRSQVKFYDNMGKNSKVIASNNNIHNNIQYAIPMHQQPYMHPHTPQFSKQLSYHQASNPYLNSKVMMQPKQFFIPSHEQKYPLQPYGHNLPPPISPAPIRMHSFPYNSPTNSYYNHNHQLIQFLPPRTQIVEPKITQQNNILSNFNHAPLSQTIDALNNTSNSYQPNRIEMRSSVNNNSVGERSKHQRILPTIQVHNPAPLYVRNSMQYSVKKSQEEIIRQQQKIIEQQRLELIQHKNNAQQASVTFKKASMFSNNSGGTNIDNSKAFYYTIDTQQQLDPEIAADLKKMQQGIIS